MSKSKLTPKSAQEKGANTPALTPINRYFLKRMGKQIRPSVILQNSELTKRSDESGLTHGKTIKGSKRDAKKP